ncbi:MAG: polynucleotide adenylyltransferase, partial [Acidimicrobiia bacterium]
ASAVRRLARRVGRLDRLLRVAEADRNGRPPSPRDDFPAASWLLETAEALAVLDAPPQPLVLGRHLIELGLRPGPSFKPLLDACFEAQLDGRITTLDEGVELVRAMLDAPAGTAPAGTGPG